MEPIPLCTRHVVATSVEDFALLDRAPEALVGALANSTKAFARMQDLGRALPVGHVAALPACAGKPRHAQNRALYCAV